MGRRAHEFMAGWLAGWLADWLARKQAGMHANWLAGWLAGWLIGWLVGWLVGWLEEVRVGKKDVQRAKRESQESINIFLLIYKISLPKLPIARRPLC